MCHVPQDSLAKTFKAKDKAEALQQVNVLLGALGDPFTRVLMPHDAQSFHAQTEGKVRGGKGWGGWGGVGCVGQAGGKGHLPTPSGAEQARGEVKDGRCRV